jgi:hypothetical protein
MVLVAVEGILGGAASEHEGAQTDSETSER